MRCISSNSRTAGEGYGSRPLFCFPGRMREGVLGHGDVLLYDDAGKLKTYVIREVAINEWSSGHKVRGYNRMPEKYRALLDKQR